MYPVVTMVRQSYFCHPASIPAGLALFLILTLAGCQGGMVSGPQTPVVTIARAADAVDPVATGSPLQFVVRAAPAPPADLAVGVSITSSGCGLMQMSKSVTIAAGTSQATLTVATDGITVGEAGCRVTAAIAGGEGYRKGAAAAASASAAVTPERQTPEPPEPAQPEVTIAADAASVPEGGTVVFTLTAMPAPASELAVTVRWLQRGSFLPASRPETVVIPTTGMAELSVSIPDDGVAEPDGMVTVTVAAGSGYAVGTQGAATVAVTDNDEAAGGGPTASPPPPPPPGPGPGPGPRVGITSDALSARPGEVISFTLTADRAPLSDLSVNLEWHVQRNFGDRSESSAWQNTTSPVTISAGSTTATVTATAPAYGPTQATAIYLIVAVKRGTGYRLSFTSPSRSFTLMR